MSPDEQFCRIAYRVARRSRPLTPYKDGDVLEFRYYSTWDPKVSDDFQVQVDFWNLVLDGLSIDEARDRIVSANNIPPSS